MTTRDSETFQDLPPLLAQDVARYARGATVTLALLEYVPGGAGVIFTVTYVHRELIYRSPGQRDAVAFGKAKLDDHGEFREVRILFSQLNQTATMKGLTLEGKVKPFRTYG